MSPASEDFGPCGGGDWSFDVYEELESLRDQVAYLKLQVTGQAPRAEEADLRRLLGECTQQREEALALANGFKRIARDLCAQVDALRERWARPAPVCEGKAA